MSSFPLNLFINTERKKKAINFPCQQKALAFVNSELELLKLRIKHPEQFLQPENQSFKSKLYVVPKSKGLGIIGLAEIVISIFLSKCIKDHNGKPVSLLQIANVFEDIFNCSFGDIYEKRAEIYNRKTCNLTKALDYLKNVLERSRRDWLSDNNKK